MLPRPTACCTCPAFASGSGWVPWTGPRDAPLLLIGQGPGETERDLGSPFIGPSGQLLDKWLALAGVNREKARVGNVVNCWLPENRPPKRAESRFCRETHWAGETAGHRIIVPIGTAAMEHFYPRRPVPGHIDQREDGTYVVGLLHPAFILRGNWGVEGAQIQTLKRVKRILEGWQPPIYDFTKALPGSLLFPTLDQMREWEAALEPDEPIVVDVENAGWVIRLVGMCGVRRVRYLGVHFRTQGGAVYPHEHPDAVIEWLYDLLASRPIICHNGFHDIEMLEEVGFEVTMAADTILMMHAAFPEGRKRLEHTAMVTSGMCGWKPVLAEGGGHWK